MTTSGAAPQQRAVAKRFRVVADFDHVVVAECASFTLAWGTAKQTLQKLDIESASILGFDPALRRWIVLAHVTR